ncbi:MAG: hypothetical protein ACREBB_01125 [Nitrosotalea sp.]
MVQIIRGSYIVKLQYGVMSMTAWKCYRCNLVFKEKTHVDMHNQVSQHHATEVTLAVA